MKYSGYLSFYTYFKLPDVSNKVEREQAGRKIKEGFAEFSRW